MSAVAKEPRITVIVIDERASGVTVSVCVQRKRNCLPIILLDTVPASSEEEAHELARGACRTTDSKLDEIP